MMKRVPYALISKAIDEIDRKEYLAALKRVGIAKARTVDIRTAEGKSKFYRQMLSRGFESRLVLKLADAIVKKLAERE